MASTMIFAHQIVHYISKGYVDKKIFLIGLGLASVFYFIMRTQMFIQPKDWLKEMIPHHSTAITTTTKLLKNNTFDPNSEIYKLANNILTTQEKEITLMKQLLV